MGSLGVPLGCNGSGLATLPEGLLVQPLQALQGLLQSELLLGVAGALVFRDRGVAVPMVNFDLTLALEVLVEHITVSMVPPPCAKLPVPRAVKHMEELWVLHPHHGEEILVPEVALEVVLLRQLLHHGGFQQLVVELGLPHGFQVQEQDTTVEAGQPIRRGVSHFGLGVLAAILPERVPAKRGKTGTGESGSAARRAATSSLDHSTGSTTHPRDLAVLVFCWLEAPSLPEQPGASWAAFLSIPLHRILPRPQNTLLALP